MGSAAKKKKEADGTPEFKLEVVGDERDLGPMQFSVLTAVSAERYDEALRVISDYKRAKFSFPPFRKRTEKLLQLCEEHISSIKNKFNIPNLKGMLFAKQEEVFNSANENWEHLNSLLKRLRAIEKEFASADAKSSLIVIKALMFSAVLILTTFLVKETFRTMGGSFNSLVTGIVSGFIKLISG